MLQGILLFPSVHYVLQAEKIIKQKGFSIKVIPVPRHLSSDCGVCIQFAWEEREKITGFLEEMGVAVEEIHSLSNRES
jgi:hypothetical protein